MSVGWLDGSPSWAMGAVVIGAFVRCAIGGLLIFWRTLRRHLRLHEITNDELIVFCSTLGVLYSRTVRLIAVATWNAHARVGDTVSREAAALDRPCEGPLAVSPAPYRLVLERLMLAPGEAPPDRAPGPR